eukprot:TRINITY_DN6499_c0_g1_i3.p1 TRINITY_DN6499_c0_g1~~TRINITY_DN6499_c0_g1_i3.p1  ORF type:complete len:128 (+),score=22.84 TRINITY_DN6499_c0_g1_i3:50-433(+)
MSKRFSMAVNPTQTPTKAHQLSMSASTLPTYSPDKIGHLRQSSVGVDLNTPLPQGFPSAPSLPGDLPPNFDKETYKEHMRKKFIRSQWEDALKICRQKERMGDKSGMEKIINELKKEMGIVVVERES